MKDTPDIAEAIRKLTEAYTEGLATMTRLLGGLPPGGEEARRLGEQWIRLARIYKDGAALALDQGFALWEREVRRLLDAGGPAPAPPSDPMSAWFEGWRKSVESLTGGGTSWSEETRRQAEAFERAWREGLQAWQRMWQTPERRS
jgi:hypothetical protein